MDKDIKNIRKSKIDKNGKITKEYGSNINKEKGKNKDKINNRNKKIIVILIIIAFILSSIAVIIQIFRDKKTKTEISYVTNQPKDQIILARVRDEDEYSRMKIYLGNIVEDINNKNYDRLYNKLYPKFKDKYFKTQEEFKNYMEIAYPKYASIIHRNIERIGDYYVLEVGIVNSNDLSDFKNIEKTYFIFKEFGFNDYYFSFSKN